MLNILNDLHLSVITGEDFVERRKNNYVVSEYLDDTYLNITSGEIIKYNLVTELIDENFDYTVETLIEFFNIIKTSIQEVYEDFNK